jgi:hypothetical protein
LHPRIPQKSNATITFFEGKGAHGLPQEVSIHEGLQTFAGPTKAAMSSSIFFPLPPNSDNNRCTESRSNAAAALGESDAISRASM